MTDDFDGVLDDVDAPNEPNGDDDEEQGVGDAAQQPELDEQMGEARGDEEVARDDDRDESLEDDERARMNVPRSGHPGSPRQSGYGDCRRRATRGATTVRPGRSCRGRRR
jgi:hypothetical protein